MSKLNNQLIHEIDSYLNRLFPLNRSITGSGNRETLKILQEIIPLEIKELPSGLEVYDWIIPDEWHIRHAWIKDSQGKKIIDFKESNTHVVSYSEAVHLKAEFSEVKSQMHIHPNIPDAIPYRTSYYSRDWGFCMTHNQYNFLATADGPLEVFIDSEFNSNGSLSIGEILIPGEYEEEILISTYICHPSLANDNLSGTIMTGFLARELLKKKNLKRSYRILWVPETIGAISYCAMNEDALKSIQSGFVVTTVGGKGKFGYKQSFDNKHSINSIIESVFKEKKIDYITYPFDIHGSDERQYSSQGFRINIATITKDKYYEYPYYHSSLDNLSFVKSDAIYDSLGIYLKVLEKLNYDPVYKSLNPNCEVMLSKYNLYPKTGGAQLPEIKGTTEIDLVLWLLYYSDGFNGIHGIAAILGCSIEVLKKVADNLVEKGLLIRLI
jgi:aminopeptidase-like protein